MHLFVPCLGLRALGLAKHICEESAVIGSEWVRSVIGVQMQDPDRVQLIQSDVPLKLSQRPAARVHPTCLSPLDTR
ncbi:hypothetical protein ACVWXU_000363 [Streptomyces sp. TE33382]